VARAVGEREAAGVRPGSAAAPDLPERDAMSEETEVAGVRLTSPGRVLYPKAGITKADLAAYWVAVAGHALSWMRGRPMTLVRCPEGIGGECFYQKRAADSIPEAIRRVDVGEDEPYMLVDDLTAVLSLVQLGTLEFHPWNARADRLDRPDTIVLDLDPGPGVRWDGVLGAAVRVRDLLEDLGLASWPRASGGKGLHVVVPLTRRNTWRHTRDFARGVADRLAAEEPDRYVEVAAKDRRDGRVFIDYMRNTRGATSVCNYSTRAREGAPVAVPMGWDEVLDTDGPPRWSIRDVPDRLAAVPDPWAGFAAVRQSLTAAARAALSPT
jgi:bifunctional non-homologous end joining protein LigD